MKTIRTTAFLTLLLVAGFVLTSHAGEDRNSKPLSTVRYEVNIHIPADIDLCNAYLILLIDGHGNPVAEPKGYIPGINTYSFTERTSTSSVRGAVMIINPNILHYICPNELNSEPVFHMGPFLTGQTYTFDLYPMSTPAEGVKAQDIPRE